jgi:heme exporter protein A
VVNVGFIFPGTMSLNEKERNNDRNIINVSSVDKAFATRSVLENIDLGIKKSQSVCLYGANGVGKSTLLRIIAGLLEPDHGSVELGGYNLRTHPEKTKSLLGVVFHKSMVYPELTVSENLLFFANLYGVKDCTYLVRQLLDDLGLGPYRYDRVDILSRGLLQRLAIARALVHRPAVLLADEPFTGLDTHASRHLIDVLNNFTHNGGSIIMTTHDVKTGLHCCNRVIVLDKRRLIFDEMTCNLETSGFAQDYLLYARSKN